MQSKHTSYSLLSNSSCKGCWLRFQIILHDSQQPAIGATVLLSQTNLQVFGNFGFFKTCAEAPEEDGVVLRVFKNILFLKERRLWWIYSFGKESLSSTR